MKTRYKIMIWGVVFAAAYAGIAIAAWRVVPGKIADAERKRPGLTMAIARIATDQLTVSQRLSDITKRTLGNGQDKVAQVKALLTDSELNRLALMYMGADWSTLYSSFLGNIKHMRDLLTMQKGERKKYVSRLNQKIKELEHEKKRLLRESVPTYGDMSDSWGDNISQEQWRRKLEDVDQQLRSWRSSNTYREYLLKDKTADSEIEAKAKNEAAIFKMACDYEAQTVTRLMQILAEKSTALRIEEAEPERMRHQMSYFNIWPLNKLAAMPLGE